MFSRNTSMIDLIIYLLYIYYKYQDNFTLSTVKMKKQSFKVQTDILR